MLNRSFWKNRKVFITGHTGFKGAWLSLWLHAWGARVFGYALDPPTNPSLYELCQIDQVIDSTTIADIRDGEALRKAFQMFLPEIVIHLAAQPLVRDSYNIPIETYAVNVMGIVNLCEAVRSCPSVRVVLNVTTDKCYENKEWVWGYRENDRLGGHDPYSSSKACSELVTAAYRNSYFHPDNYARHGVAVASARAGNVIGGGDWAADRLVPDCLQAILRGEKAIIRNPRAIRPWQHVLEPLGGYLLLAQKLYEAGPGFGGAWNFGPHDSDAVPVEQLVKNLCFKWGNDASYIVDEGQYPPHETNFLRLDCSKSRAMLGWRPHWNLDKALDMVIEWTSDFQGGKDVKKGCLGQIDEYLSRAEA